MIRKALLGTSLLGVGWLIAGQRQDITRYLKIKQMSTGGGHPENVPVRGSVRYVQPGQSLPDGVGEFDSALRGGPPVPR